MRGPAATCIEWAARRQGGALGYWPGRLVQWVVASAGQTFVVDAVMKLALASTSTDRTCNYGPLHHPSPGPASPWLRLAPPGIGRLNSRRLAAGRSVDGRRWPPPDPPGRRTMCRTRCSPGRGCGSGNRLGGTARRTRVSLSWPSASWTRVPGMIRQGRTPGLGNAVHRRRPEGRGPVSLWPRLAPPGSGRRNSRRLSEGRSVNRRRRPPPDPPGRRTVRRTRGSPGRGGGSGDRLGGTARRPQVSMSGPLASWTRCSLGRWCGPGGRSGGAASTSVPQGAHRASASHVDAMGVKPAVLPERRL